MSNTMQPRRSERLVARVTPEDKSLLERAAALQGCSVATFVLTRSRAAAQEVIQDQETIRLNEAEARVLVKSLLAPEKKPTARMKKALKVYRKTVRSDVNPGSTGRRR